MAKNSNLTAAKKAKNDEFYTQRKDIEAELRHYAEHFKDKVVYCNCDDPEKSEFWKFFARVFKSWGLKKLIATYYKPNAENFIYKIESMPDDNGELTIDMEPAKTPLPCNGDFRSAACIELLKGADIVVTNPPFSLFREYVAQLMKYEKKFLIIGNINAITYKEFFPLLKDNKVWAGFNFNKTMEFIMPDSYALKGKAYVDEYGRKHGFVPGVCWYTNLDIKKRHQPLDLRGNRYYGNEMWYPRYDNYDAIECSRTSDIPGDYNGVIGVPITFLSAHCPEQFEILGLAMGWFGCGFDPRVVYKNAKCIEADGSVHSGGKVNTGPAILHDMPFLPRYYIADNADGYLERLYSRILIRRV